MARKKVAEFNFNKAFALIEALDKNKEEAVEQAIINASRHVQKDLADFAESKKQTGKFREALKENPQIENTNGRIEMELGFYKDKPHGYLAHYFNKGTPTMKKTGFIDKAFKNQKAIGAMNWTLSLYFRNMQKDINDMKDYNKKTDINWKQK